MKKTIITLSLILFSLCSFSQAALFILLFGDKVASENFHLSLDAGANLSIMHGLDEATPYFGLNFGMGTHIKLNDKWHLSPEIKPLSTRGANNLSEPVFDLHESITEYRTSKLLLNYLDLPILIQRYLSESTYISAGPQLSILLSGREETEAALNNGPIVNISENIYENMSPLDFSILIELGYKIVHARSGKGMHIRLRYSYGFADIIDSETDDSSNQSTVQLIVSFPFVENPSE